MLNIIDTDNKPRVVRTIKKIKHLIKDINGNEILTDFVEVMVVGKEREWIQYYPLEDFKKLNPNVSI